MHIGKTKDVLRFPQRYFESRLIIKNNLLFLKGSVSLNFFLKTCFTFAMLQPTGDSEDNDIMPICPKDSTAILAPYFTILRGIFSSRPDASPWNTFFNILKISLVYYYKLKRSWLHNYGKIFSSMEVNSINPQLGCCLNFWFFFIELQQVIYFKTKTCLLKKNCSRRTQA